ncbi:hypothetical protein ADL03_14145 [Nocardia sp. NRRL S-836]|nr:hypothetical protein ADL03_14145 [Nocardia sp. NRRL S-836]
MWTGKATDRAWALLAEHPVLAARVRGTLSALRAQTAGERDHAVWATRIAHALRGLELLTAEAAPDVRQGTPPQESAPRIGEPVAAAVKRPSPAQPVVAAAVKRPSPVPPVVFLAPGQVAAGAHSV